MKRPVHLLGSLALLLTGWRSSATEVALPFLAPETVPGLYQGISDEGVRFFKLVVSTNQSAILVMAALERDVTNVSGFYCSKCIGLKNRIDAQFLEVGRGENAGSIRLRGNGRGDRDYGDIVGEFTLLDSRGRMRGRWGVHFVKNPNGPYSEMLWKMSKAAEKAFAAQQTNSVHLK